MAKIISKLFFSIFLFSALSVAQAKGIPSNYSEVPGVAQKVSEICGNVGRAWYCHGKGCKADLVSESGLYCLATTAVILDCYSPQGGHLGTVFLLNRDR